MSDRRLELELHTPEEHKFFHIERRGTTVHTSSGNVGHKGRSSSRDHGQEALAEKAFATALGKKLREGYFVRGAPWPLPVELDASDAVTCTELRLLEVPRERRMLPKLRDVPPPQLEQHRSRYGFHYADGPGESGLWFPGSLHVGVRHFIREVSPPLHGEYDDFAFRSRGFPARPDGAALLVGHEGVLWELEVESAQARELYHFASHEALSAAQALCYAADGGSVLWWQGSTLVALATTGDAEPQPVYELPGEPIVDMVRLASGALAVLQASTVSVLELAPDARSAHRTHAMPCRRGYALGTWLEGRVLVVCGRGDGPRTLVCLAVDESGALHELHASRHAIMRAFDSRGAQWMVEAAPGGNVDQTAWQVLDVEPAWARACARPAIEAGHVLDLGPLHDAIAEARTLPANQGVARVRAMHARGAPLETRAYQEGWTALGYAAMRGEQAIVALLLELGAALDGVSRSGRSALASAIERDQLAVVDQLLAAGASPTLPAEVELDGKQVRTESPLVAAARRGLYDLVVRMLDAGADVDATGHDGATAFCAAAQGRHPELARLLLERGASVDAVRSDGPSPLQAAVDSRDAGLVGAVAARSHEVRGPVGAWALRCACLHLSVGSVERELVDHLVAHGAAATTGEALQFAIGARHAGAVRAMLAAGADPNAPHVTATKPSLPLQAAFAMRDIEADIVDALLEAGADVSALDNRGLPALNYAVVNCSDPALVGRLLDAGARPDPVGNAWGALHQAAWSGRLDLIDLLLERGASIDATTADGRAALAMAAENGQHAALRHLLDCGAAVDAGSWTALMAAAVKNDLAAVELLLEAGAQTSRRAARPGRADDPTERTAQAHAELAGARAVADRLASAGSGYATLNAALAADDLDAVRALLDAGADPNASHATLSPALNVARSVAAIELLVARGARVETCDVQGNNALFAVARSTDASALERLEALLAHGADPAHTNAHGQTPLHAAARSANLAVARRLLDAGCPVEDRHKRTQQPLHLAARHDQVELARLLLDRGARVEPWASNLHGAPQTPLHLAAEHNAAAVARLLLARGASTRAGADPDRTHGDAEHDEVYGTQGGYTPIHRAAEAGHFEVLVELLRGDTRGARFLPTVRGRFALDLAVDHPRCHALLSTMQEESVDVDAALAQLEAQREAARQADVAGRFWIERVDEQPADGTGLAPAAVRAALGPHDWVRTVPGTAHSLVLRFVRGEYEVAVGDADGVHALPVQIRTRSAPYHIGPESGRFLVSDGRAVYAIDAVARSARELVPEGALPGPVKEVGWLDDEAFFVIAGQQLAAYPARAQGGPVPQPWWTLPTAGLKAPHPTGTRVVALVLEANVLRTVFASMDRAGLRLHGWLDDATARLSTLRGEDGSVHGLAYSRLSVPRVYRLHHLEGMPRDGAPIRALPGREIFDTLPRLEVAAPQAEG